MAHTHTPASTALWQRVLLVVVSPIVFLIISETLVRLSGVDTDLARNENFEIAVPVWALSDENWVDIQRGRLERPQGVPAADVAWLQYFEEARYLQYKLKPNIAVAASNPFNEIEMRKGLTFRLESNRDGFRTAELRPKAPGVIRIVTLGDSSTFGWGVDPEYTYQRLLEDRLADGTTEVEVLNLGMPGHTTRHGMAMFDHYARALDPDLVVLQFGANDARLVLQSADELLAIDETWRGGARSLLMRVATFRLMRRLIFSAFDPFAASRARADREGDARRLVQSVPRDTYIDNLIHLVTQARAIGADTIVLGVCVPSPAYLRGMQYVADTEQVPLIDGGALFREKLDDLRGHRLYADEVFFYEALYGRSAMEANWRLYVTTDGCHPGRAGHSVIADALQRAIEDRGLR